MIKKQIRDEIVKQSLAEIAFARRHKQGKIKNWHKNEDLYLGKKIMQEESRANVDLGRMQEFVHSLLSKIDNPLVFKFSKRKAAQLQRVRRLNALRQRDARQDMWDIKDIAGKKQAIMYGRAIYTYYADSYNGYCPHLENVDCYDFLVDPSAGGLDLESAYYLGRFGIVKMRNELEQGVKDGLYLKTETNELLEGSGNSTDSQKEVLDKSNRVYGTNVYTKDKEIGNIDKYKFWEWYTTYKGDRYYLLLNESGSRAIRVEKLVDIFSPTKLYQSGMWPFWTWSAFIDLTEFWSPSYCDFVREIFMAQTVSINQMLDNSEQINKPQKVVNVNAIENLAELKYKRDGYIKVKGDFDVNKAVQYVRPNSIDTPAKVYEILEAIQEKASGVTASSKGVEDTDGRVAIYEGNQANVADRFGLLNKSYSFGYTRFAKLWEIGVKDHLNKKVAVDILGPEGVQVEEVTKRDLYTKDDDYSLQIESSNAEMQMDSALKRVKMTFLMSQARNPSVNKNKLFEMQATLAGLNEEEVRQLLDTSDFGDEELMAEAERDIEYLLEGKKIQPNQAATTAYKQKFVDYMQDNVEHLDPDQFRLLAEYVIGLDEIIMRNMVRMANNKAAAMQLNTQMQGDAGGVQNVQPEQVEVQPQMGQELPM